MGDRRRSVRRIVAALGLALLVVPVSAQGSIDPVTGQPAEEWLPWNVTRRLLSVTDLQFGPRAEIDYLPGALFEGAEALLPEESQVVASLRWKNGGLLLFDVGRNPEDLIEEMIDLQSSNGFALAAGGDWGILENPSTFPLEFCGRDGGSLSVSGDLDLEAGEAPEGRRAELAIVVREGSSRACSQGSSRGPTRVSSMPRPVLYAPRGVQARRSGTMSDIEAVTRTHNLTAPQHEVGDLLADLALQMEEQGWFGSPPTDFGGAAAQMFTQYAEAPDEQSTAGWLSLILLSRHDLETGAIAAQISIRRVVQKAP